MSRMAQGCFIAGVAAMCVFVRGATLEAQTPEEPADTGYVNYDTGPFSLPFGVGLRIPSYNRVDGLVLPWGPNVSLSGGRVQLDPTVTYRSNLGEFDPHLRASMRTKQRTEVVIAGGRSTFTNDAWIRSDLINTLTSFGVGTDARNYFRADRGTIELTHEIQRRFTTWIPSAGFLYEHAWSTGIAGRHSTAPWSILGRTDTLKMRRINPPIWKGHTTSALAGLLIDYEQDVVTGKFAVRGEHLFDTPGPPIESLSCNPPSGVCRVDGPSVSASQLTFDAKAGFPTFRTQSFAFRGHALTTFNGDAPPQRYSYLGGAGTLATVDLLALGGDHLLFVEGEYSVPLVKPLLPFVGAPVITLRYAAGSAGVGELPEFIQNLGVGVGVRLIKAEYHIDPNYQKTSFTRRSAFSIGFSLTL